MSVSREPISESPVKDRDRDFPREGIMGVTARNFENQLRLLGFPKERLKGSVLSIGPGLSDFVMVANQFPEVTCIGVDPVFNLVQKASDYHDFSLRIEKAGLTTKRICLGHGRLDPEQAFLLLKQDIVKNPERYISQKAEKLDLPPDSQDLILACQSLTNLEKVDRLNGKAFASNTLRILSLLKPSGQINIYPFFTQVYGSESSLEGVFYGSGRSKSLRKFLDEGKRRALFGLNANDDGLHLLCLQRIVKGGGAIYALSDDEYQSGHVPTHSVLVIRKDEEEPRATDREVVRLFPSEIRNRETPGLWFRAEVRT